MGKLSVVASKARLDRFGSELNLLEESLFKSWFKIAVSVIDSDDPETYRSRCIGHVSTDTQNKMIKIF